MTPSIGLLESDRQSGPSTPGVSSKCSSILAYLDEIVKKLDDADQRHLDPWTDRPSKESPSRELITNRANRPQRPNLQHYDSSATGENIESHRNENLAVSFSLDPGDGPTGDTTQTGGSPSAEDSSHHTRTKERERCRVASPPMHCTSHTPFPRRSYPAQERAQFCDGASETEGCAKRMILASTKEGSRGNRGTDGSDPQESANLHGGTERPPSGDRERRWVWDEWDMDGGNCKDSEAR